MYKIIIIILMGLTEIKAIDFIQKNKLYAKVKLHNTYKSGHVVQGITSYYNSWIISQTNNDKEIILSFLNKKGEKEKQLIINYSSHGQDLSILKGKYSDYLITTSKNNHGVAFFKIDNGRVVLTRDVWLSSGFNTPSVSENGLYIVVKNYNMIRIYKTEDVLSEEYPYPIYTFLLSSVQQQKEQAFQGLAVKDGYIYALSGDKKIKTPKYLVIYDFYGSLIKKFQLYTGKSLAKREGKKWELEGLTFRGDKLYTTVMSGKDGKNIKRIYKILEIK